VCSSDLALTALPQEQFQARVTELYKKYNVTY
jgi:hypothetical protein